MDIDEQIDQQIASLLNGRVKQPASESEQVDKVDIDTREVIYHLALAKEWTLPDYEMIDFLSTRIEISQQLFCAYHQHGRKASNDVLEDTDWQELAAVLLLKAILTATEKQLSNVRLKRFNALFKLLESVSPVCLDESSVLISTLTQAWQDFLVYLAACSHEIQVSTYTDLADKPVQSLREIPLTVLFYEGPIARAYLETIKTAGFKPKKIIQLVAGQDVATRKLVGRWLPESMRCTYAANIQKNKIHFWPNQLIKNNKLLAESLFKQVEHTLKFSREMVDRANALLPLSQYSDCIEPILVNGLQDKQLLDYLAAEPPSALLFTGGGMVPADLLTIPSLKFLHIHPGFLPDIRGADCVLWSTLLTGHASASCFYLSAEIDTGDIIKASWLPRLSFNIDINSVDQKIVYRAIYSFLDPWVRSFVLREIIHSNRDFLSLTAQPQMKEEGITFHFMHGKLQKAAFQQFFKS